MSEATLSSCTLATAIGLLLANASEKGTYSGRFKCSSGWFTFHCYYANDGGYNSGYEWRNIELFNNYLRN